MVLIHDVSFEDGERHSVQAAECAGYDILATLIIDTELGVTDNLCDHPTTLRLATQNMNIRQKIVYILSNLAMRCGSRTRNIARLAF